ncbi:hypothetical protein COLO4_03992 [Corchorus olitorius]|uniref:Uncharacterized protein n=1 Tax=Corchorus olitorius TaxID=93759 RepID=A0A1R3KVQ8_9ROSI|nr:hypothetical protein COLO4_03992 [Corchorus olitorius]
MFGLSIGAFTLQPIYLDQNQLARALITFCLPPSQGVSVYNLPILLRPEKNPLDLNNLPDDYTRDGCRKKKSGAKDGKDECGKVYECRCHPSYHPGGNVVGDPTLAFRSVYPPRLFSAGSSATLIPAQPPPLQPPQPYLQPSPSGSRLSSYPSQYPTHGPMNDLYVGHVLGVGSSSSSSQYPQAQQNNLNYNMGLGAQESNYTCIGAPVGHRGAELGLGGGGRDMPLSNQEEGLNWVRSQQQRLDHPSAINRFQDGF